MKKTYLNVVALSLISLSASAQRIGDLHSFAPLKEGPKLTAATHNSSSTSANYQTKALNVVWTEDFSGGSSVNETSNGQWNTGGLNASFWGIGDTPHPLAAYNWTDAMTNEYLTWDSYNNIPDEAPDFAITQANGVIESPSISYSATNSVGIKFQTEAMYCCNATLTPFGISVSTDDGSTWSDTLYFNFGVDRNEETEVIAHPLDVTQSLESIVPAGNQSTFKFKFVWDGNLPDGNGQYNSHYFWLIDNVELYEIPSTELALINGWHGDIMNDWEYSMLPLSQAKEIVAGVVISNGGSGSETVDIACDIYDANGVVHSATPTSHTIAVGDVDTVWISTGYTPSANGVYHVVFSVPTDDIPNNDTYTTSTLTINDNLMAHDYGSTSQYGWSPTSSTPDVVTFAQAGHAWGQIYSPTVDETVYGMDIFLGSNTTPDIYLIAEVFEFDLSDPNSIQGTLTQKAAEEIDTDASNLNKRLNILFSSPFTMTTGKGYIFQVSKPDGTTTERFYMTGTGSNKEDDDRGTVGYGEYGAQNPNGPKHWLAWGHAFYIRPNFQNTAGLFETSIDGISIYPNPTEGKLTITNKNNYNNTIEVVNLAGKVIYTGTSNKTESLDLSGNGAGVYFVNITNELGTITEKVILK